MRIYGLMLIKGESERLYKKNTLLFHNKPMFLHNLDKCLGIFDRVYVSSDDDDILDWADSRGAYGIKRPKSLCGNTPNIPVYKHATIFMDGMEAIVAVQANSPTILPIIIKEVKDKIPFYDEIMTIHPNGKLYGSVWAMTAERLLQYRETEDYYDPKPKYKIRDESIDIHTSEDFEKALKQI